MAVRVAKLECSHAAARCRQSFRTLGADRLPSRHTSVAGNRRCPCRLRRWRDAETTSRRCGCPPDKFARRLELHEHELLIASCSRSSPASPASPKGLQNLRIGWCARWGVEPQRRAIKGLRAAHIGHHTADADDRLRLHPDIARHAHGATALPRPLKGCIALLRRPNGILRTRRSRSER